MKTLEQMARDLRLSAEMYADGLALKRAQLRRADPEASEEELARRLRAWLLFRPEAPDGDGEGVRISWPRR